MVERTLHVTKVRDIVPRATREVSRSVCQVRKPKHNGHSLWRKRETLLQERIVQYTTIDADGTVQELVEKELTAQEMVRMECRDTGEFAHRESATPRL